LKRTGSTLVLPRIILREAVKNYGEEVVKKAKAASDSARDLDHFVDGVSGASGPTCDFGLYVSIYETALLTRLSELAAEMPEYEDLPLKCLVERALRQHRPFGDKDKGFRDSVLWETVLQKVAKSDRQTVLITNDSGFTKDAELHPDLKADLSAVKLTEDAVLIYDSLEKFLDQYAKPLPPVLMGAVIEKIRSGKDPGFSLSRFLGGARGELLEAAKSHAEEVINEASHHHDEFNDLEEVGEVTELDFDERKAEILEVVELDRGRVFIEAAVYCSVAVDGFMFKANYFVFEDSPTIQVLDSDWSEHYMWVQLTTDATMTVNITFDADRQEVESWEIQSLIADEPNWEALDEQHGLEDEA
jgi:hypothetical protein